MTAAACHPDEFLEQKPEAIGVTPTELARQLHVPANRITQVPVGNFSFISGSTLHLARWFGEDLEKWMELQARHDLEIANALAAREITDSPTRPHKCTPLAKRWTKSFQARAV